MSAGIQTIALLTPIVASNAIFSARRASKGVDSISENPIYGAMNMDIAAGQVLKGARAAKALAIATDSNLINSFTSASDVIKSATNANKIFRGLGKVVSFTADNINPVICVTSGIKVLGSDDKVDAAARESLALGTMFGAESLAKNTLGMPFTKKVDGKIKNVTRKSLADRNLFVKQQVEAMNDFCATKKLFNRVSLKAVPSVMKGLLFVGASIAGYKLGTAVANTILGEPVENKSV